MFLRLALLPVEHVQKVLISEHKQTHQIIPGDQEYSDDYNHYLVKLSIAEDIVYSREAVEYADYMTASEAGIDMMDTHMIEGKHFGTRRFDRQEGRKKHILTATGITGWAYPGGDPRNSSYENLFRLALHVKLTHSEIGQLYRGMIFNVIYENFDDHLKNHSFIYDQQQDLWQLAPAYDLTYSLNPMINVIRNNRVLSINGKMSDILLNDLLRVAEKFTIKNPKGIISQVQSAADFWKAQLHTQQLPEVVVSKILRERQTFDV